MKKNDPIKLGNTVQDIVTGFTGIAVAYARYLDGSEQWGVKPSALDNKYPTVVYIDINTVIKIDDGIYVKKRNNECGFRLSDQK